RRRHTRFSRDWSSDVCSSDLFDQYREKQREWLKREIESPEFKSAAFRVVLIHISPWHSGDWHGTLHCREMFGPLLNQGKVNLQRSEERRVGKECSAAPAS